MSIFKMPSLGADMEDGTLIEWLVKPGDKVESGDVVAVVETHKGAIEIEIFESGVIENLEVAEGEKVPVGAALARLRGGEGDADGDESGPDETAADEAVADASEADAEPEQDPEPEAAQEPEQQPEPPTAKTATAPASKTLKGHPGASPAARNRAAEAGVELADITGSGPGGAVLLADVEAFIAGADNKPVAAGKARKPDKAGKTEAGQKSRKRPVKPGLDMAAMRQAIAAAMSRSKREIPHYYLRHTIDLQTATDWLAEVNAERDPDARLLMGALFIKATALALKRTPELNGQFEDGVFTPSESANIGLAVSMRGGGLIAPAIPDVGKQSLDEVMTAMRDVVARTRTGRLRNSEMTSGTITISSMGENGVEALYGVIYPPQVALLGFGTPVLRPRVVGGNLEVRNTVTVTLSADHRVSDGRRGARLLTDIEHYLMEPDSL